MEARGNTRIVALALLAAALATAPAARAERVSVVLVAKFPPARYAQRGAVGLFVPGAGKETSRRSALASLVRGKARNSLIGPPSGPRLIALDSRPGPTTIYVALPPPGRHPNRKRYPIAIVGSGYRGLLVSGSTRIPGLVSIADIAPTALALEQGRRPAIRSRPDRDAPAELAALDRRLRQAHKVHLAGNLILFATVLGGSLLALGLRSPYLSRAALLAAPAALGASLALSAAGIARPSLVVALLVVLTLGVSLAVAGLESLLLPAMLAIVAVHLVVLAGWPTVSSLQAIGAHPEGGGRYYGLNNLPSAVLLTVTLLVGSLVGLRRLWLIAALSLVTVGWSRAGADGGGLVTMAIALLVLAARLSSRRWTWRAMPLAAGVVAAGVLLLVGLDAATGGSSHVTRAVRRGPGSLFADLGGRIHVSTASIAASWTAALVFAAALAAIVLLATRWPRFPAGDALLVGIAVSLLVNDSPTDVAGAGALSYGVLWTYERVRREPQPAHRALPVVTVRP